MSKRILIEAVHPEEVRVVVTDGSRLHDFDFESSAKKQIKGNIYLAKVSRVEPSLQAAFVEYGGNRQGFLPFSEIHPDYYQIPSSDKPAEAAYDDSQGHSENYHDGGEHDEHNDDEQRSQEVDVIGEEPHEGTKKSNLYRRYKIQEVIKRNQILLVQVIKEERGTKGASLTTYISLAGRYIVLMPNSERQGGVSRRIADNDDRKRLKTIADSFDMPPGTSMIIRTAGLSASKADIKRDYDYLSKLWDGVKDRTLSSQAPAMIHEEGDLVKRTIRDLYDDSIEEIVVEGEKAYENARDFMKTLAPGHSAKVKQYKEGMPIFWKYGVENEIAELYDNKAYLRSGGYIVINSTEALVAIDVNSGRSTRERNVEETATKTNLEAAYEIARQFRLRDLAGLIVIDFIDMMDGRNRRAVERALKDALVADRAKIQVGRISPFGLLEMSRQRLRSSFIESSMVTCSHCNGTGVIRSPESAVVSIIRAIDSEAAKSTTGKIIVNASADISFYLLNKKREDLTAIEQRHNIKIFIEGDENLTGQKFVIDGGGSGKFQSDAVRVAPPLPRVKDERPVEREGKREEKRESTDRGNVTSVETGTGGGQRRGGRHRRRKRFDGDRPRENREWQKGGQGRDGNRDGRDSRDNNRDGRKRHGVSGGGYQGRGGRDFTPQPKKRESMISRFLKKILD